jgi:hypothetical protein
MNQIVAGGERGTSKSLKEGGTEAKLASFIVATAVFTDV